MKAIGVIHRAIAEGEINMSFYEIIGNKAILYVSYGYVVCLPFYKGVLAFENINLIQRGSHETLIVEDGL